VSDTAYQNALAKKQRLLKELEEVNSFLKLYQRFAGKVSAKPETSEPEPEAAELFQTTVETGRVSRPKEMGPIVRDILLRHGHPMPRGQLVEALAANGTPVPGENKNKNLGTIMWRLKDEFVNLWGKGYWPKDVACPEYDPKKKYVTLHMRQPEAD